MKYKFYNEDCIIGMKKHVDDNSIDLIITDPPYGISGETLDKHYNRKESNVIPGYIDVLETEYQEFSHKWIKECERILRPSGSLYIISGYSHLREILNSLYDTELVEVNHLIWKYSFGVYTKNKYVSSHYHILFYVKKPENKKTFNTFSFYNSTKESYNDRLDVFDVKREYRPGEKKNKNQLPESLVEKLLLYSSNEGDAVFDPFLGGFTVARVSLRYNRIPSGFEMNSNAFSYFIQEFEN